MSVFRTLFLADSFGVRLSDGSQVVITRSGTNVADGFDLEVREAAAEYGIPLLEGGAIVPGRTAMAQRVDDLQAEVALRTRILDEIPPRTLAYTATSGQMVPCDTTDRTSALVVTLPPGGTGTRVGIRLDAGPQPVTVAGTGQDSVPATTIAAVGTVVILEGIRGGGGWRVTSRFAPDQAVDWSQIQNKPTIPTSFAQLNGSVSDAQIPSGITRDTELDMAIATRAAASHTHPYAPTSHTHALPTYPMCKARLNADPVLSAGATRWASNDWIKVADPNNMITIAASSSGFSTVTAPIDGWWWVSYRANYGLSTSDASVAAIIANGGRALGNNIARDSRGFRNYGDTTADGTPVHALELVALYAGDVLYWGNWSNAAVSLFAYKASVPTALTVSYFSPF